ncbi:hypothetical protein [Emticicia sp. 17c]|uniref:hypothetical protein n=1 Tax=Emticicia sp. 17c TaxID=3127704 RepID=UPI00301BEFE8
MALFYKVSDKEFLTIKHKIFKEVGIPALEKNRFVKSPFSGIWFGEYDRNINGYSYELCRLSNQHYLEIISVDIVKGDEWIQIRLNIFELKPNNNSLKELNGVDGIQFHLPPNSITKMRLRIDDFKGMPLFRFVEHKIGTYYTKNGFESEVEKLRKLIKKDMTNIDHFVKRWHELHTPLVTDWKGNKIE